MDDLTYKNDNNIGISVIIPHYNSFTTLRKLIDSIPNRANIQVIVIDDRSEDVQEYKRLQQEYFNRANVEFYNNTSQTKGAGTCRNIGLYYAKGKWLVFADADDFFSKNAFDVFFKYYNTEADIVYFGMTSVDLVSGQKSDRHDKDTNLLNYYLKKRNEKSELLIRYNWIEPVAKMVRADMVSRNDIKYDEIIVSNDVMFSIKAAWHAKKIDGCRDVVYVCTKSSDSLTQKKTMERSLIRLDTEIRAFRFLKDNLSKKQNKILSNCGIYSLVFGAKMYGSEYAKKVIDLYRKNGLPIFRPRIISVFWIQYNTRIFYSFFRW